jgi:ketosteroid isomerase-like protein
MKNILLGLVAALALTAGPAEVNEVTAAMEALKQAMLKKDGPSLEKLLSDDLVYIHSGGQQETKAQFVKAIATGKSIVERLDYFNPQVRVFGNTALVNGAVDLYHSKTDIVHMNILHVWVKGSTGWKMVSRQATRLAPPAK